MAVKTPSISQLPSGPQQKTELRRSPQVWLSPLLIASKRPCSVDDDTSSPQHEGVPSVRSAQVWCLPTLIAVKGPLSGGDTWTNASRGDGGEYRQQTGEPSRSRAQAWPLRKLMSMNRSPCRYSGMNSSPQHETEPSSRMPHAEAPDPILMAENRSPTGVLSRSNDDSRESQQAGVPSSLSAQVW